MIKTSKSIYRGYRFPAEVIEHAVWLYFRFPLSLRMVEDLLAARGITTQVAGGSGYSLLALVDAELAMHRTASTDALHAALKAGRQRVIAIPSGTTLSCTAVPSAKDYGMEGRAAYGSKDWRARMATVTPGVQQCKLTIDIFGDTTSPLLVILFIAKHCVVQIDGIKIMLTVVILFFIPIWLHTFIVII